MFGTCQRMESTIDSRPVDSIPSEYKVHVKRPGRFSIKDGDGFCINLFADTKYRRVESAIIVESHRTFDMLAYERYSRLQYKQLSIYLESYLSRYGHECRHVGMG